MKQPKKLTREQKECLSAHYLNCKDWIANIHMISRGSLEKRIMN